MDSFSFLPDGGHVVVEGECQDIVRRIRDGDPTKGWEGDPSMRVFVSPYESLTDGHVEYHFEVWGIDRHGEPYLAVSHPTGGPELIDKLIRSDTRRRDVIADAMKAQEALDAEKRRKMGEVHEEMADKLAFALQGENAGHFGGKGRLITIPSKPGG